MADKFMGTLTVSFYGETPEEIAEAVREFGRMLVEDGITSSEGTSSAPQWYARWVTHEMEQR